MSSVCELESPTSFGVSERLDLILDQARRQARTGVDELKIEQFLIQHVIRKPVLQVDAHGTRYLAYPGANDRQLGVGGNVEEGIGPLCERILKPGMVVLDMDGGDQLFPLQCARIVSEAGRVVVFPANRMRASRLRDNVGLNQFGNIHVVPPDHAADVPTGSMLDRFLESSQLSRIDLIRVSLEGHWRSVAEWTSQMRACRRIGAVLFASQACGRQSLGDVGEQWGALGWEVCGVDRDGCLVSRDRWGCPEGGVCLVHQSPELIAPAIR